MPDPESLLAIGRIGRPHGIRGGLSVISYTDPAQAIFSYQPWYLGLAASKGDASFEVVHITSVEHHHAKSVVYLPDVLDRNQAAALTHREIYIEKSMLPTLADDEVYWYQLEGLAVYSQDQQCLGHIEGVVNNGACDLFVIRSTQPVVGHKKSAPIYIPYTEDVVQSIDLDGKKVFVDWTLDD